MSQRAPFIRRLFVNPASAKLAVVATLATASALVGGCENQSNNPPPQTAQNPQGGWQQGGQYPQQQYPQQQYPQQQYPQQPGQYPQQPGQYPQQPGTYPQQPGYPQQPQQPQYPQQPGQFPQQPTQPTEPQPTTQPGIPGWPFPAPQWPIPGQTQPQQPGQPQQPQQPGQQPASGAATPIDPNLAQAATLPLMAFAQQEAPGMQKEGGVIAGQFKEGQTLEQAIQIVPGKCYTVLAVGVGIQEMDIALVATTPLPGASPVLAQDQGSGAQASLGGRGNCFKWSLPVGIQAKYVLKATKGQGMAAGQLYVK